MKTSSVLLVGVWLATVPDPQRQVSTRFETATVVSVQGSGLLEGEASVSRFVRVGGSGAEILPPSIMAGAVGAGDSTDGYVSAGPSYLDIALDMCTRGCTANAYVAGLAVTFSLVYSPVRIFFGGYLSGCLAGCYGAYASRW